MYSYDYLFKVLLIGSSGVGKTATLYRFTVDEVEPKNSTCGVDFKIRTIELDGKRIKVQTWDTTGEERFRTITTAYYRGAMGIMLLYDITDEKSFDNLTHWIKDINDNAPSNVEKILVGNKCDLNEERKVTKERGERLAQEYGFKFFEISAKSSINVEEAFLTLAKDIKNNIENRMAHNTPPKPYDYVLVPSKPMQSQCTNIETQDNK